MADRKRVLLVEDDVDFLASVRKILERGLGVEIDVAYDGVEGGAKVAANPPDLIVLDVMMPNKDGYRLCAELKADDRFKRIPVILLTAVADHIPTTTYSQYDGMATEAEEYVPKPVEPEELLRIVKRFLD
ncbi:MAG: response regulator [Myxococcota bacterium]|nr:response regulator [Myxococcota bacterium]